MLDRHSPALRHFAACVASAMLASAPTSAGADDVAPGQDAPATWPLVRVAVPRAPGMPELQALSIGTPWRVACVPPCALRLDPLDAYRIGGVGVVDSDTFRIPDAPEVRIDAVARSPLVRDIGTIFVVGGFVFAVAGGAILLLPEDAGATADAKSSKLVVGTGFLAMGLLTTTLGLVLRMLSDTTVSVSVPAASR